MKVPYIECQYNGCTRPVQGTIESFCSSTGIVISFVGKCTDRHSVGRALSKTLQRELESVGWTPPLPGKSCMFILPKVKIKKERSLTITMPANITWVLVNTVTRDAIPLPDADVVRKLEEKTGKLIGIQITLGEKVKKRKTKEGSRYSVEKKQKEKKEKQDPIHKVASRVTEKGSISLELADKWIGKEHSAKWYVRKINEILDTEQVEFRKEKIRLVK